MSKSLGNNLDPLDITAKFGADAARMALIVGNTPGTDMRLSEDKIKAISTSRTSCGMSLGLFFRRNVPEK